MAAGKFHWYTTVMKYIATGAIDLEGDAVWAYLLHDGYSPSTASHSAYSDISADIATASATIVNGIALSAKVVTGSGATTVKWDAADIDGFSSDGSTIGSAKYLALVHQTGTAAARLIGFIDLNTDSADASVGESTQINITWPSGGIGKLDSNP
jgi:hypothetical protein